MEVEQMQIHLFLALELKMEEVPLPVPALYWQEPERNMMPMLMFYSSSFCTIN
jgi:hypothetical protein